MLETQVAKYSESYIFENSKKTHATEDPWNQMRAKKYREIEMS